MTDRVDPGPALAAVPPLDWSKLHRSRAGKVAGILVLLVLLQVPLSMVSGLVAERAGRQDKVLADLQQGWGPAQEVAGPTLVVPFDRPPTSPGGPERPSGWARLQPAHLRVMARLQPEVRRRGLFHAIVYSAAVDLSGDLTFPSFDLGDATGAVPNWARARLVVGVQNLRGIPSDAHMSWNGIDIPFDGGESDTSCRLAALSVPAGLSTAPSAGTKIGFHTALTLRGTQSLEVLPLGREVDVRISSSSLTPGFTGAILPETFTHNADGFDAQWNVVGNVSSIGWHQASDCSVSDGNAASRAKSQFGVNLQEAVPTYLMVTRASKYDALFVALSFLTLFLFEAMAGARVHLVQYGLVGLSVSLFALLLVSLAEPLGFSIGYLLATMAILAQASLYAIAVLRQTRLAVMFAGMLGGLFAFLYVVITRESDSLLTGSIAVFVLVSAIMFVTRRLNWAEAER